MKFVKNAVALGVLTAMLGCASLVHAEIVRVDAVGKYTVGDAANENMADAKEKARQEARRVASEKVGVYIESFSKTQNYVLTQDEVTSLSANVLKIIDEKNTLETSGSQSITFVCRIVAEVNSDGIDIDKILAERNTAQKNVELTNELEAAKNVINSRTDDEYRKGVEFFSSKKFSESVVHLQYFVEHFESSNMTRRERMRAYTMLGDASLEMFDELKAVQYYELALKDAQSESDRQMIQQKLYALTGGPFGGGWVSPNAKKDANKSKQPPPLMIRDNTRRTAPKLSN